MALAVPAEQKQAAVAAVLAGEDVEAVAKRTRIALAELARLCLAQRPDRRTRREQQRRGRKPKPGETELAVLRAIVEEKRRLTQQELAAGLAARTGKRVGVPVPQSPPRYTHQHRRQLAATTCPSMLTDLEWAVLEPLLAKKDGRGKPPTIEKRALLNAIFHVARTGTPCRHMPKDLPDWQAAWSLFRRLRDSGTRAPMYDALHAKWREVSGLDPNPTAGIVDSQTVKSTEKGGVAAMTPARRSRAARGTWSRTPTDFPAQS
jgi:transposase